MPDSHVAVFVETNHGVFSPEGPEAGVELMEADKGLAEDVESLLMSEVASVDEAVRDVLSEYRDIFMVGAEVRASFIICSVGLNYRFFGVKTIVVGF